MADGTAPPAVDYRTEPARWRHWRLDVEGRVATLTLDVDEQGGILPGYELKLNSYDLGVDIELRDALERLRFEHPAVGAVLLVSGKERVFSAGANIRMLAGSSHAWKVNFCKFTNETRNALEEASAESGLRTVTAIAGACAGGGYELALATDWLAMADDGATAVSLPEVPLLGVLPGTGGLTRLVDKRRVRRDRADVFCTLEEGVRGQRAVDWGLVDEVVPRSRLLAAARARAAALAAASCRPAGAAGIHLEPLARTLTPDRLAYAHVSAAFDRAAGRAEILVTGPEAPPPSDAAGVHTLGTRFWPLGLARELDDLILHLRSNEPELGLWVFRTEGSRDLVEAHDHVLAAAADDWLVREIRLLWRRTLKRLDVSSRSLFALVEPGSCFAGTLLELALAADRVYMLAGARPGDARGAAAVRLSALNFGAYPMVNGLTRLGARCFADPAGGKALAARVGEDLDARAAEAAGIATVTPDDLDWEDEVRLALEERAAFSPDALTGMEASLRFAGPETAESKVFARLSAWQNWIFLRPNAAGAEGALRRYGTGRRGDFDRRRV